MLRRSKHCPWDDSGSPEGADGDSGDLEEDVTARDRTLHVLTVDATPLGGTITAGVVSQMGSPFAEDTPRCIVSAAAAAAVEDADGNNIEWKPLKEVFSDEDWASAERLGFPLSVDPELRAAEQEAMPLLQATALRCEKHWHSYSRGLPLLSNATVEATEFMRQSLWRYGAPCHLRGVIWLTLSGVAMRMDENQGFCRALLERHRYMRGEHADAIEKDLRRTFPGHPYFAQGGVGMRKARNVLHALCWRNPLLNYCQSFNYLVAFILLVLDDEESTFWLMCHLLENLLPNDLYSESLIGTRVDQLVLQELVQERLPRLALHFSKVRFEAGTLVSAWVMVLFVTVFPVETVLRVWDCLFAGCAQPGSPSCVLLEVVLAVLKLRQHNLLQCDDAGDVVMCLNHSVRRLFDAEELMQVVVEMRLTPLTVQRLRRRLRPIVAEEHRQREQRRQAVQKRYLLRQQGATVETPRQHMGENEEGRKEVKESGRIRRVSAAVAAVDAQEQQQQQQQQPQLQQLAVPHSRVTHPHRCERPREPRQREYRDVFAGMGFADGARHRLQCGGQEPHHGHVGDARNCDGNMRRRTGEESCGREMESISAEVENREKSK
ncbi:putative GTPase activator protein [Trypanosoma grayi]|uniref:putative GTPase activator protein n=1 Tax=Trypanosoma grayi TaxID=71804 RepID=UPI0004F422AE|nr:putative GTPase activator protein [Trypanosoma grayi]KEG12542.1 putative GTPase activator protein [Trypanosoma grayi]